PGDRHMEVAKRGCGYVVHLSDGPKVSGHRPSVDILFASVAREAGGYGIGVLLTGMGRDGASELKTLRDAGGRTVVQDQTTSVVWGMPMEADRIGAAEQVLPIDKIGAAVQSYLGDAVE
ncbi:MAG: CheB methylesterase domain-containing protein, partial [Spirochaetaceae bacterium]|nr:CheB methylesterase domain-containing protein [Spirochaetaceae bacterium]